MTTRVPTGPAKVPGPTSAYMMGWSAIPIMEMPPSVPMSIPFSASHHRDGTPSASPIPIATTACNPAAIVISPKI